MCGFAGFVPLGAADPGGDPQALNQQLQAMRDSIAHRGPDQAGQLLLGGVGLAARRLSIIDRSGSDQPIQSASGRTTVVYNGEVYNYASLREELLGAGVALRTAGDTEVIPNLYERHGIEGCLRRLRGIFAFALWDANTRTLYLCRDRFGVKPAYYGVQGKQLLFGSELKALLAHPQCTRRIDETALAAYLLMEYVPAPRSIYAGLRKLPAGHYLKLRDGQVTLHRWWQLRVGATDFSSKAALRDELDALLHEAAEEQLVSEVPLGVLLSGGVDSTSVAWFATQALRARGQVPRSFSLGFADRSFDESAHFLPASKHIGTDHYSETLHRREIPTLLDEVLGFMCEPLGDGSLLPTYALSRMVKAQGYTVVLSGDGGDEPWAGYPTYLSHQATAGLPPLGSGAWTLLQRLVGRLPTRYDNVTWDFKLKRLAAGLGHGLARRNAIWLGSSSPTLVRDLMASARPSDAEIFEDYEAPLATLDPEAAKDPVTAAQYLDVHTYMTEDILAKVDRVSMAVSLEVRVPLLDHRVVELAFRTPRRLRLRRGRGKWLFKSLMRGRLPDAVLDRPKKGFGLPIGHWLRHEGRDFLQERLGAGAAGRTGLLDQGTVDQLITEHLAGRADHRRPLWALLVLCGWLNGPFGP